eukprot:CAMPEP_0197027496 /NCGR_PEP_ID=MMETSP1384-20130603/7396_1 /TAXON_ID=29189 /ORGANISM="Ammonia sp." /LENGTH=67 /DNA_ID=CAMNT_0042456349 /DNA_START=11 /DNA_END=214 /DNA_ORIENTATION=+
MYKGFMLELTSFAAPSSSSWLSPPSFCVTEVVVSSTPASMRLVGAGVGDLVGAPEGTVGALLGDAEG